jgi:uncharacterized protein (UPF0305 family)
MSVDLNKGYDDQELLLRAVVTFTCTKIDRSENIIWGLMRQSINDWTNKSHISMKEIRHLDEAERLKIVNELINIFVDKVKHLMDSNVQRDQYRNSVLNIYEQWKKTKRAVL